MIKMESLLYNNIDLEVYKAYAISTVSAVAEKSNTYLYDSKRPMRVTAKVSKHKTCIVKLKSGVPEIRAFKDAMEKKQEQYKVCVDFRDERILSSAIRAEQKMFACGSGC